MKYALLILGDVSSHQIVFEMCKCAVEKGTEKVLSRTSNETDVVVFAVAKYSNLCCDMWIETHFFYM